LLVDGINIEGAREHNLRGVKVSLPRHQLIVFTGLSGSGKSSLAFDTLYAEGQRLYVESLSPYARQFMRQLPRPRVDRIEGLCPSVAIQQGSRSHNPRSTVATITELYDYLRVMYATIGEAHCPQCDRPLQAQSRQSILDQVRTLNRDHAVQLLAPLVVGRRGQFRELFEDLRKRGYARARVDGEICSLDQPPRLERYARHDVEVVVDRLPRHTKEPGRLEEAVDGALERGEDSLLVLLPDGQELRLSRSSACPDCGVSLPEMTPASFSFNSPRGMCPTCEGLGVCRQLDPSLLVEDPELSLRAGAVPLLERLLRRRDWHWLEGVAEHFDFSLDTPWQELTETERQIVMHGSEERIEYLYRHSRAGWVWRHHGPWEGLLPWFMRRYKRTVAGPLHKALDQLIVASTCPDCHGQRLCRTALAVRLGGRTLAEVLTMSIAEAHAFFTELKLSATAEQIAEEPLKEVRERLAFLEYVGLPYLNLNRTAPTLSGGEAQRLRLASQIGSGLTDCLYVLDEPSIGLHHRDQGQLIESLRRLRDQGNTILVVEHDEQTIRSADWVVDFGPGAGERGGEIVAAGTPAQIRRSRTLTGDYLAGRRRIEVPATRRPLTGAALTLHGARAHNLRDVTVSFPLDSYLCVTGVSGSGKSSLITDTLYPALARALHQAQVPVGAHERLEGTEHLDKVVMIDQAPIGRTPRSNPATYTGVFTLIRDLYTQLPEARTRGYKPGRFSFNVAAGRCPECEGYGAVRLEADFLAEVWVPCEKCGGQRFDRETLEITYRGANIAEVLDMEITEAREHFAQQPRIARQLQTLIEVGLGYVKLGQAATTLSGGEAQRVKLAKELARPRRLVSDDGRDARPTGAPARQRGRTLYVLDEPTVGLHFEDVRRLLEVLQRFVDEGHTVLVVEHHPDLIKCADWVIDLGPEGGEGGGRVLACGTPEQIAACPESYTGQMLREVLPGAAVPAAPSLPRRRSRQRTDQLVVRGARMHNLQDLDVTIPRRQFVTLAGLSGSGKTSLALDTVYAEGQRRFVASLSPYARQFVSQMPKPRVDHISGLSAAIAVESRNSIVTPRSTVGTVTQIYDYLRVLYARVGQQRCPDCHEPLGAASVDEVVSRLLMSFTGQPLMLLAPLRPTGSEEYRGLLAAARRAGWSRLWVDGQQYRLPLDFELDRRRHHEVAVIVDRLSPDPAQRSRLAEAVEAAFTLADGNLQVRPVTSLSATSVSGTSVSGTGVSPVSAATGVSARGNTGETPVPPGGMPPVGIPEPLSFGTRLSCPKCGVAYDRLGPRQYSFNHPEGWCPRCWGLGVVGGDGWGGGATEPCPVCHGERLNRQAAATAFRDLTLPGLTRLPLDRTLSFMDKLRLTGGEAERTADLLGEIKHRLGLLVEIGLDYLTLERSGPTLSGGEAQRVNLAGSLGTGLTGVMYVLDEPTVGIHPQDNDRMLAALRRLHALGNSLLVVEHDLQTLAASDYIVEFGPGAGVAGGRVVAQGTPEQLGRRRTLTGDYLSGRRVVPVPADRRSPEPNEFGELEILGATEHNLADLDVRLPLGRLVCVSGPSGSGKSTLINDVLYRAASRHLRGQGATPGAHREIRGLEELRQVVSLDQSPIGQSPRSNPATYVGVFDLVRDFYARLPEARRRGYAPGRFSFNKPGGRCETCEGLGARRVEMHFLPDVWVTCETCGGQRYQAEVLEIKHQGKSISEVLEMTIGEARRRFADFPRLARLLDTMCQVGLDYLPLGQAAPTLSGGEAQRVKLARELVRPLGPRCLYLLDEPTTGLHPEDVSRLLRVLQTLVEQGNSVVIIEHNLDVLKSADYLLDLGPGGGDKGGRLVAAGPPEAVAQSKRSATAPYLRAALEKAPRVPRAELLADLRRRRAVG
jgi:excinuclease ABC subunit A